LAASHRSRLVHGARSDVFPTAGTRLAQELLLAVVLDDLDAGNSIDDASFGLDLFLFQSLGDFC
jgi:hypothetical protein